MTYRVLLVEDDKAIARLVCDNLKSEGFEVEWSDNGRDVINLAKEFAPDLVLLDLTLPSGVNGFELCRALSSGTNPIPVIIVTARGQKEDRVRGLTLGADDYVVKPFALEELLARVHAVLRRTKRRVESLKLGETVIDFKNLRAHARGREILLSEREFGVLRRLAEREGSIVSRDEMLRLVWGYAQVPLTRTVDNFIFRLRRKIEPDPHHPKYIRTAYGDGYRLSTE